MFSYFKSKFWSNVENTLRWDPKRYKKVNATSPNCCKQKAQKNGKSTYIECINREHKLQKEHVWNKWGAQIVHANDTDITYIQGK